MRGALGAGCMGEGYRARDKKFDRDVALKVLPEAFKFDPDRLARLVGVSQKPLGRHVAGPLELA